MNWFINTGICPALDIWVLHARVHVSLKTTVTNQPPRALCIFWSPIATSTVSRMRSPGWLTTAVLVAACVHQGQAYVPLTSEAAVAAAAIFANLTSTPSPTSAPTPSPPTPHPTAVPSSSPTRSPTPQTEIKSCTHVKCEYRWKNGVVNPRVSVAHDHREENGRNHRCNRFAPDQRCTCVCSDHAEMHKLDALEVFGSRGVIPTLSPTPSPTLAPTPSPTPAPTLTPTPSPTFVPSPSPTFAPSPNPTADPTPAPTASPTPACTPGTSRSAVADACVPCPRGKFSAMYNAPSCSSCQNGRFAVQGAVTCSDCVQGRYHPSTGSTCHACATGKFSEWVASVNCVKCPIGKFQDKIAFHMCDPCEIHMWTLGLDGASLCTSIPTPHPTPNPTPLPTAAPTAYPTSYPTAYPTVATPTAEETAAHTSATSTVLSLAGVTAQEFGSTQRQAVLEAVAADYDVHVSQVSLEVLSGRRLTEATEATEAVNPLRVKIRVRCRQAKALQVKAKMALLAASPALQSLFASLVDNFLARHGSALAISVASIADPVVATGAPTAYPTPFPTSYPTPVSDALPDPAGDPEPRRRRLLPAGQRPLLAVGVAVLRQVLSSAHAHRQTELVPRGCTIRHARRVARICSRTQQPEERVPWEVLEVGFGKPFPRNSFTNLSFR